MPNSEFTSEATAEPTTTEKLRGLPWSYTLNATNTIFTQFTFFGSAFVLFLDHLGLSKSDIGFILSLIPFSGLIAPLVAPATARFGYKRTFVLFFGLRKLSALLLLLTPWVVGRWGAEAALAFVAGVVGLFSLLRSVEETAYYPWNQEFIPAAVRGKYSATSNILTALVGVLAVWVAGSVVERSATLFGFMALITVGVIFGLISTWAASRIPGGAPIPANVSHKQRRDLGAALRDADFLRYLAGLALITLATAPVASFIPLFLEQQVGLSEGNAVLVQMGTLLGTMLSSYAWGWATDRFGSRPVMLTGVLMLVILPLFWWLIPRHTEWSLYAALAIAFAQGMANLGWGIGATKLLFVTVVPADKKMDYLALWFAWAGITAGISQLVGGWILDWSSAVQGKWLIFTLDAYTSLFVTGVIAALLSLYFLLRIRGDSDVGMGQFVGLFVRGNPFAAVTSLVRYHWALDEQTTVQTTERLGRAGSKLVVEELLEALADPRFNVRFEAILAIARMPPEARLFEALAEILQGNNPALSVIAAWALGRIGGERARGPLRQGLSARYRSIRAHSARALGAMGDTPVIPQLQAALANEGDEGLRVAYAAALGSLRAPNVTEQLLNLLESSQDASTRLELALALARLVGEEGHFIQLWRATRSEPGTAGAQAVSALRKKLVKGEKAKEIAAEVLTALEQSIEAFARNELAAGARHLGQAMQALPSEKLTADQTMILQACASQLTSDLPLRNDYLLLAVHTLEHTLEHTLDTNPA